jgi:hypothetical protein
MSAGCALVATSEAPAPAVPPRRIAVDAQQLAQQLGVQRVHVLVAELAIESEHDPRAW